MEVKLRRIYTGKDAPQEAKIEYDKTSKKRPAWILVKNLPDNIVHLSVKVNENRIFYRIHLSSKVPLFLPSDYTKEEMKKFYDKLSEVYDSFVEVNLLASKFLLENLKLKKDSKILDLGAGTGLSSIPFAEKGYDVTLIDFSKKMLEKAKKRKELKNCKFIYQDITKLNLKEKFDLMLSVFSFASNTYLNEKEMPATWEKIANHLELEGKLVLLGYDYEPPSDLFKKIKSGKYEIIPTYETKYYIGEKCKNS